MMPISQLREPRPGAVPEHSLRHFSESTCPPESLGLHPQGRGQCRLTLVPGGAQPFSHVPQGSEAGQEPPTTPGPSLPFWAAATSSCFRFCTVSLSEERRGEKPGFQVPPGAPPPTAHLSAGDGWLGGVERVGDRGAGWGGEDGLGGGTGGDEVGDVMGQLDSKGYVGLPRV